MSQAKERITAFDFARALAIFGMVMVNYKLAMQAESGGPVWLQAIAGLFEGEHPPCLSCWLVLGWH